MSTIFIPSPVTVESWDSMQVSGQPNRLPFEVSIRIVLKGVGGGPDYAYQWLLTAGVENFGDKNYREHLDLRTGTFPLTNPVTGQVEVGPGLLQPGVNFYFGAQLTY